MRILTYLQNRKEKRDEEGREKGERDRLGMADEGEPTLLDKDAKQGQNK